MPIGSFTPQFIFESELTTYGLPTVVQQPDILNLVQFASSAIDESCGRIDGDGAGSLVYTTYSQRILLQNRARNLIQLPMKPIVSIDAAKVSSLMSLASSGENYYYTGALANTIQQFNGSGLSGIISCSGRYGYTRQDQAMGYPDLWSNINPLNLITLFGGPAPFIPIDIANLDYDSKTGEAWIPAGLQLQKYSEIVITYNSGYDPTNMPRTIKHVCASMIKNLLAKGDGTTAMKGITLAKSGTNIQMGDLIIDPTLDQMLSAYRTIRAY